MILPDHPYRPAWFDAYAESGWRIRRAWPRAADHVLLDLLDPTGHRVAAEWRGDAVIIHRDGQDARLPAVSRLLDVPGRRLVAHRPGRRAVIAAGNAYLKVMRPSALPGAAARARTAMTLDVGAPDVLAEDAEGILATRALPGAPLTTLLGGDRALPALTRAGELVAALHARPVPPAPTLPVLALHGPEDELGVVARWERLAACDSSIAPGPPAPCPPTPCPPTPGPPAPGPRGRRALIHRDLHDGQVVMTDGAAGLLDFDLLAVGDPALDVANLLVHLELRAEQGVLEDPSAAAGAFLEGYRPDAAVRASLPFYEATTRARLRAVYAFRDPGIPT